MVERGSGGGRQPIGAGCRGLYSPF